MKNQFVTYQLALKLKELGFDEQCFAGYKEYGKDNIMLMMPSNKPFLNIDDFGYKAYSHQNKHVTKAPLLQQAFDWFRKEHKLHVMFETVLISYGLVDCRNNDMKIVRFISSEDRFLNQSALKTEALKELIELVETKKDSV